MVLAAVGSGKTTTLARRIAAHIALDGIPPERVLAVTFTNRAAAHVRAALAQVVGRATAQAVHLGTFHALCADILRSAAGAAGLPPDLRIIDEDDVDEILRELGAGAPRRVRFRLHEDASRVPVGGATLEAWRSGRFSRSGLAKRYVAALDEQGAIDFAGLVLLSRGLLAEVPAVRADWAGRFDAVLVDEVQDTHSSEYAVLRVLAAGARSRCFVGDLDQTIYGWRGSAPRVLLDRIGDELGPARERKLTRSFRATGRLIALADAIAADMPDRASRVRPGEGVRDGEPAEIRAFPDEAAEHAGIAGLCAAALAGGADPGSLAVLARTNRELEQIAAAFDGRGVPCTTAADLRYTRRMEIKDALALVRLVVDRHDETAARRVARRLVRAAGPEVLRALRVEGRRAGLQVSDLFDSAIVQAGAPLAGLHAAGVVVLDTETTGLDPTHDEVIEIAAVRVRDGVASTAAGDTLCLLVQGTVPVGDSATVHHISDAQRAAEGVPAAEALRQLADFVGTWPIGGHNVGFDRTMLESHAARVGVPLALQVAWDTLPAARRLVATPRHTLGHLVEALGLPVTPTHRALDDVEATIALAAALRTRAEAQAPARRALLAAHAPAFARIRGALDAWAAAGLRPGPLAQRVVDDALGRMYHRDADASARLAALPARLAALDAAHLPATTATRVALDAATLSREVDALDAASGVRLITVHQSKGQEFPHVIVPGLVEGVLPGFRAQDDDDELAEERRVFYVAATRAKRRLTLTWHRADRRGRPRTRSRFLDALGAHTVEVP